MFKKVRDLVYSVRGIQVKEIAQALGISHGSVLPILHERLGMRKLTTRWVIKSLRDGQMATRALVWSTLLKRFRSKDFILCLVTVDETWAHYYEPEKKAQWVMSESQRPNKFKTQPFAGKVIATAFWDTESIIMLDFLPKRSTNLLDQLRIAILEKRECKLSKGIMLLQDNAKSHSCNGCCRAKRV